MDKAHDVGRGLRRAGRTARCRALALRLSRALAAHDVGRSLCCAGQAARWRFA